jgi:tRNA(His) guanylyltransferase
MQDDLGDRMKEFERRRTDDRFDGMSPIYARIDGRGFSKFTQGLRRPFDERLAKVMVDTAAHLVVETGAKLAFAQSDEISLVWEKDQDKPEQTLFFDGKVQKLTSVLAGMATAVFINGIATFRDKPFAAYAQKLPHFDARIFEVPDRDEAANAILWRFVDARKNAIQMLARHHFSHKELHGVSTAEMLERLAAIGVVYEDMPAKFRYGTFVRRTKVDRPMTEAEMKDIPEKHRPAPGQSVVRTRFERDSFDLMALSHTDRAAYVFST